MSETKQNFPPIDTQGVKVFAVVVGGLGSPQGDEILKALQGIPGVFAWSPPWPNSQYKAPVADAVRMFPTKKVALIVHSFAGQTAIETCIALAAAGIRVNYVAFIDPVSHDPIWASKMALPPSGADPLTCDVFRAWDSFPVRPATIVGGPEPFTIPGTDHNTLCHDPSVIARVVERVRQLAEVA